MPIANYTTTVPAVNSVLEIQKMLVAHGAKAIMIFYTAQEPTALSFLISTKNGDIPFQLPANIDAMKRVLEKQLTRSFIDRDRAARVAWRVLKDWTRAQLAILETEMVTLEQVMLPYMMVNDKQSLYEAMREKHFYLNPGKQGETNK